MLALDRALPDLYRNTEEMQRNHRAICEHEKKRLKCDHADDRRARHAQLELARPAMPRDRQQPQDRPATSTDPGEIMDRCVALSGSVADLFLAKPDKRQFAETALAIERSIGLDKTAFGQVIGSISAIIPETEAIFDADPAQQARCRADARSGARSAR